MSRILLVLCFSCMSIFGCWQGPPRYSGSNLSSSFFSSHCMHCSCGTSWDMIYTRSFFYYGFAFLFCSRLFSLSSETKRNAFSLLLTDRILSLSLTIAHISMSSNAFCPGDRRLRWMHANTTATTQSKQINKRRRMCYFLKAIFKMIVKRKKM